VAFTPKSWADSPSTSTPISAAALEDLESRLAAYAEGPTTVVSSLPGSPVDGQEVYYLADGTNGVMWHLKYRAGSSSSYKWEFVGGSALKSKSDAGFATGSADTFSANTYTPLTGVSITAPLAGDYETDFGCVVTVGAGQTNQVIVTPGISGAGSDANAAWGGESGNWVSLIADTILTGLAASTVLTLMARSSASGQGCTVRNRWMSVRPVRVG